LRVLENAKEKVQKYNDYDSERVKKGKKGYNDAYHRILRARQGNPSLVNADGTVSDDSIDLVEQTMIAFDMKIFGQIDDQFKNTLKNALSTKENRALMKDLRDCTILINIETIKSDTKRLFENLSCKATLSAKWFIFGVGATKIMNFLFPELFVILDRNVKETLSIPQGRSLCFDDYWKAMDTCRRELGEWQKEIGTIEELKSLDEFPTTPIRIFDKCAFMMGRRIRSA